MTDSLKLFETETLYNEAKPDFVYPTVSYVKDVNKVFYMKKPNILDFPIKAVFYDSSTGSFVKLYPDQITEVNPNYTPIGVEVVPAEHDVYGTGQAGIMSLAEMNYTTPDVVPIFQAIYNDYGERMIDNIDGTLTYLIDGEESVISVEDDSLWMNYLSELTISKSSTGTVYDVNYIETEDFDACRDKSNVWSVD